MTLSSKQCTPYLSVSLYKAKTSKPVVLKTLLTDILRVVVACAQKRGNGQPQFPPLSDPQSKQDSTSFLCAYYVEERQPSWCTNSDITDRLNQLIVIAKHKQIYALLFSDTMLRNSVVKEISCASSGPFSAITRLGFREINRAFVGGQVRTLWLNGTHRQTTIKPDSKILSGLALEHSLNPLGDQTYYFSSVRSTMPLSTARTNAVIGASPGASRIWMGPTRSWDDFASCVDNILTRADQYMNDETQTDRPLPVLACASASFDEVKQPYDIALIVPELINDGVEGAPDDASRWLQQFADVARFEITATDPNGSPNFEAAVYWADRRLGRLSYNFAHITGVEENVRLKISKMEGFDEETCDAEILKICRRPENITIYFDSGHTFSRGQLYKISFRDAKFSDWHWVSMARDGTVFSQEKPLDGKRFAVENTGEANDTSLFGLIARHWPNLENRGTQTGWLVCDDGAMESADFIHIDAGAAPPEVTLIHVKGSGSDKENRGISVSDYEVVVGQAIKNLRHVDCGLLKEKLEKNANGALKNAVWHDGQRQNDRAGLLAVLDTLGSNRKNKVVVFQPRVRHTVFKNVRRKMEQNETDCADVRRMQQLDALLLAARADCFALGAEFRVIADDDECVGSANCCP